MATMVQRVLTPPQLPEGLPPRGGVLRRSNFGAWGSFSSCFRWYHSLLLKIRRRGRRAGVVPDGNSRLVSAATADSPLAPTSCRAPAGPRDC